MIDAVLVVLTKAVAGREADMEDWYTNIHIRDALRFRGSVTAQRFRLAADQPCPPKGFDWQYLAFYDVFDPARFSREHLDNALTSRMQVSDAIAGRRTKSINLSLSRIPLPPACARQFGREEQACVL